MYYCFIIINLVLKVENDEDVWDEELNASDVKTFLDICKDSNLIDE